MQKTKKYLKYIPVCLIIFGFVFLQVMTDLKLPDYMSDIVDKGILLGDMDLIKSLSIKMLGVAFIGIIATIIVGYLAARVSAGISLHLRNDVFEKVESFSMKEFDKFSTASLITRSTNDIQQIQMFVVMFLRMIVSAPIMAIGGIIKAVDTAQSISWILAVSIPLTLGFIFIMMTKLFPVFGKMQGYIDNLNMVSRENLTGMRVIRAFRTQKFEQNRFDKANLTLTDTNIYLNRMMALIMPSTMLILNLTQIAIIWFGAKAVNLGEIGIGDVMAYIQYAMQVLFSFLMLSMVSIILPRALVSWKRVREILKTEASIMDSEDSFKPTTENQSHNIEFKNVSFSYPEAIESVLNNISFIAKSGETTAFIGSTGCGKSTLINLIPRYYDVTDGEILVDGVNIKKYSQSDLHNKIGYVPQKGVLFSGTIESNIKLGLENSSDEEMKLASKIAQAEEFILEKEEEYSAVISQGGTNVSGGQKQRISIARALIKKPEIYIFDDSFSALDFKTDKTLREALKPYTRNSITLIVAQRISTIMNADQIVVLDEGNVVGIGTHKDLMISCDVYKEIASSQLSKEELE